jgi:hypothetical protein
MVVMLRAGVPDDDRAEPPAWEIPALLPRETIIARSDDVAISVGDVHVYSRGVLARFYVRFDPQRESSNPSELTDFTGQFQRLLDPTGLVLDIRAPDDEREGSPRGAEHARSIHTDLRGCRGNNYLWQLQYWAFPLPANGVVYSAQWSSRGVERGRVTVSAAEISTLLSSVQHLRPAK